MIKPFEFTGTPKIIFGTGNFKKFPEIVSKNGDNVLVFTGGSSLRKSGRFDYLITSLKEKSINTYHESVRGEPSPELVDELTAKYRGKSVDLVVSVGGGSVIDTGKAVSALLPVGDSVMNYLEGVGDGRTHPGNKISFIAVPTTSGTGSEATKNAVLSRVGEGGFKKSFRHDNFIPDIAILDPELTVTCPSHITAASGLDALSQLIGAYTSTKANPFTDSMTIKGIEYAVESLIPVSTDQGDNLEVRSKMACAALISGIGLANAGLVVVHGLASTLGAHTDIPHGVVCGTLLGEATALNIRLLQERDDSEADVYLQKYARIGAIINGEKDRLYFEEDRDEYCSILINTLREWIDELKIPRYGEYGFTEADLAKIAENSGIKNNPVKLDKEQIKELIKSRL